jgi:glutamine amidotransferase PdxT
VLASECRLESINVNVQRNQFGQQKDSLNVNSNVGFRIVPK